MGDPGTRKAAPRGDRHAFETLYDRYHLLVYGLAVRLLSDPNLAEDVTQTVFLKIWSAPERFREGNFTAWIARVTRNQAVDVLRAINVRAETAFPAAMPAEDALEEQALARIEAGSLKEALSRLPDTQREVIELGFFGGITHEEIARRLNLPLGTVKTRIRTGLRRLRETLDTVVTA